MDGSDSATDQFPLFRRIVTPWDSDQHDRPSSRAQTIYTTISATTKLDSSIRTSDVADTFTHKLCCPWLGDLSHPLKLILNRPLGAGGRLERTRIC